MINFGQPVLAASDFRKSSFSGDTDQDTCVYVARLGGAPTVEFRDSKRGLGLPGFAVSTDAFRGFIAGIRG